MNTSLILHATGNSSNTIKKAANTLKTASLKNTTRYSYATYVAASMPLGTYNGVALTSETRRHRENYTTAA